MISTTTRVCLGTAALVLAAGCGGVGKVELLPGDPGAGSVSTLIDTAPVSTSPGTTGGTTAPAATAPAPPVTMVAPTATTALGAAVKVAWVSDVAGPAAPGVNAQVSAALAASAASGSAVVSSVVPVAVDGSQGYDESLSAALRRNPDLVVAAGLGMVDSVLRAARSAPMVAFVVAGVAAGDPALGALPNVAGVDVDAKQTGFVGGVVAGQVEAGSAAKGVSSLKRVVAVIAGRDSDRVERLVSGFVVGVRDADPGNVVRVYWADSLVDAEACYWVTRRAIADGADLVLPAAGPCGEGVVKAAADAGIRVIGVGDDPQAGAAGVGSVVAGVGTAIGSLVDGLRGGGLVTATIGSSLPSPVQVVLAPDVMVDQSALDVAIASLASGSVVVPDRIPADAIAATVVDPAALSTATGTVTGP